MALGNEEKERRTLFSPPTSSLQIASFLLLARWLEESRRGAKKGGKGEEMAARPISEAALFCHSTSKAKKVSVCLARESINRSFSI